MNKILWRLIFTFWACDMKATINPRKIYDIWRDSRFKYHYAMDAYEEALIYWKENK